MNASLKAVFGPETEIRRAFSTIQNLSMVVRGPAKLDIETRLAPTPIAQSAGRRPKASSVSDNERDAVGYDTLRPGV